MQSVLTFNLQREHHHQNHAQYAFSYDAKQVSSFVKIQSFNKVEMNWLVAPPQELTHLASIAHMPRSSSLGTAAPAHGLPQSSTALVYVSQSADKVPHCVWEVN